MHPVARILGINTMKPRVDIRIGDCRELLKQMPDQSVNCCVTSPPYFGLRSYMPNAVSLKPDAPEWVLQELEALGIYPVDHTSDL
jgi:DNA modification methylase